MKKSISTFCLCFVFIYCLAQFPEKPIVQPNSNVEQQLENITENNADNETEDDSYLQEMLQYQRNPININTASVSLFSGLRILSPIQVQNIINYRNLLGDFVNIYELQAVPGLDLTTLQRLRPYITVSQNVDLINSLKSRLVGGDNTILIRVSQILEQAKGYVVDPNSGKNFYPGSPQRILLRYRYNFKNNLQYGFLGEKDGGEQFFKVAQKQGFDFYSFHFFAKNTGIIKSLAIGDYTVNVGQGLTQWMSLAFKKSPDVISIKRQADVLRPYNSAGEINFHRGIGITLAKKIGKELCLLPIKM